MQSSHSLLLSLQNEAVDVDIDEILDMDTDDIRRSFLFVSLLCFALISVLISFISLQSLLSSSTCKRSEKDISVRIWGPNWSFQMSNFVSYLHRNSSRIS